MLIAIINHMHVNIEKRNLMDKKNNEHTIYMPKQVYKVSGNIYMPYPNYHMPMLKYDN